MISATPPPSIEVSLFGAVEAPSTSSRARENLQQLETYLEGISGRPGTEVAEREVRIKCLAGGELRLCRPMQVPSSLSSPSSVFDLSSAATEWTLAQVGPPLRGRGAATLSVLARPVTGITTSSLSSSSSGAGVVEACVAGRHVPAFFASAGFALDFSSGDNGGEVFRTGRRYRLFRSGPGKSAGAGAGAQGAAAASKSSGAAETEQISKGGASSAGSGVLVTVSLTESFAPLLPGESLSSALSPGAAAAEGAAAADAAALGAAAASSSFVCVSSPSSSSSTAAEPVSQRFPGLVLVSVTAVASEADYAAAAAQVGALAEVLRPWVELRKQ